MKIWADPNHESYGGKPTGKCFGCRKPVPRSSWGYWCHPCNVVRLTRLNDAMAGAARAIGDEETARALEGESRSESNRVKPGMESGHRS